MKRIWKDIFVIGFALFSMFFGAGNVVFPPYLGLESGHQWFLAFMHDHGHARRCRGICSPSPPGSDGITRPEPRSCHAAMERHGAVHRAWRLPSPDGGHRDGPSPSNGFSPCCFILFFAVIFPWLCVKESAGISQAVSIRMLLTVI